MWRLILVTLYLTSVMAKDCDCSDERLDQALKETNDIVEFLNVLASKDAQDDEKYPGVLPGLLTGTLGCDCAESLRKKRKIFPEPKKVNTVPRLSTRNCAKGYVRVATICMPQDSLL